jgi:hypothetical protein
MNTLSKALSLIRAARYVKAHRMRKQKITKTTILQDGDSMDIVKIEIGQDEWLSYPEEKRERIKDLLMEQYGYDLSILDEMVEELQEERREQEQDEIWKQFYGDEE